ncbi:mitochondrial carrier [Linnemannia elongata AG-77]|uniref:Mitochondrial carrier n=1 Tax=Linnemannia elongata AG-77 TaxID=1314771 RepID=A0A197JEJ4_9FUNG|nr:mitochondrial carrier [Linnemannia elongata AG-77]
MTVQGQHSSGLTSLTPEGRAAHVWTPGQELAAKLLFGGLGCMIAVVFTHPVDVIKTRLQLQGEAIATTTITSVVLPSSSTSVLAATHTLHPTAASSPTAGGAVMRAATTPATTVTATQTTQTLRLIPLLRQILRTEGPRVFVAGLAPAVLRESIYSTIRLGSYDYFKGIYSGMGATGLRGGEETTTLVKLMSGLTSGMIGSAIANPTDLIKVRLQAFWPSGKPRYASIADACRSVYIEEGIPGLYRGVVPTAARAMVVTASQLASYDTTKHWLLKLRDSQGQARFHEGYLTHFCASTFAGLVCSISTSPIDTVKVRYMNQQFNAQGKGHLYRSAIDCAIKTVQREGPLALYKGFLMCWLRLGPHTMLSLMIFEKLRSFVGLNPV